MNRRDIGSLHPFQAFQFGEDYHERLAHASFKSSRYAKGSSHQELNLPPNEIVSRA